MADARAPRGCLPGERKPVAGSDAFRFPMALAAFAHTFNTAIFPENSKKQPQNT